MPCQLFGDISGLWVPATPIVGIEMPELRSTAWGTWANEEDLDAGEAVQGIL